MKLTELANWTSQELEEDIAKGGKFVTFTYAISLLAVTYKRTSKVFYIKYSESPIRHGWPYVLLSLILGWWGFPWGPIYTIQSLWYGFVGVDVTDEIKPEVERKLDGYSIQNVPILWPMKLIK